MAAVRQASEQYNSQLKDKIHRKLEVSQEKRELQMKVVQDRLREHVSLCLTMMGSSLKCGHALIKEAVLPMFIYIKLFSSIM